MPIPIIIAVLIVVGYLIYKAYQNKKKRLVLHIPAPSAPAAPGATPTPKKGFGLGSLITAIVATGFLMWWFTTSHPSETKSGIQAVQPVIEMELVWILPDGQTDRGLNSDILPVRIIKNTPESLWFDTVYSYSGVEKISNHYLEKSGDKLKGSWAQAIPKDGGSIELKKMGELLWVGNETDRSDRYFTVILRQKMKK